MPSLGHLGPPEGSNPRLRCQTWVWVPGLGEVGLHHLYRAMRFLGEEKDRIEEGLFARNRDLFSEVRLVFFDTTSFYFHGEGGELGERGYSRDRRPELVQVVAGALLAGDGRPIACEVFPGNVADAKVLLPVVDRARERFPLGAVGVVVPPAIREAGGAKKDVQAS